MRKATLLYSFLVLFLANSFSVKSQSLVYGNVVWEKVIGSPDYGERARDVFVNPDGSIMVLAGMDYGDSTRTSVLKIDSSRNILWETFIPVRGLYESIIAFDDTSWLCLGTRAASDTSAINRWGARDVVLTRINSHGNIMWSKNYGGSANENAENVIKTSDGGFAVLCQSASIDGQVVPAAPLTDTESNPWVFKINPAGNLLWQKSLEYLDDNATEYAKEIFIADNEQLVVYTYVYNPANTTIAYFVNQASGAVSFNNSYNGIQGVLNAAVGIPNAICKDESNGTFLFSYNPQNIGPLYYDNHVKRISQQGTILSIDTFGTDYSLYNHAITSLSTGGYLTAGSVITPPPVGYIKYVGSDAYIYNSVSKQVVLFGTNSLGSPSIDDLILWDDEFLSLRPLPGGEGVIASGHTRNYLMPIDTIIKSDIWIAKIYFNNTIRGNVFADVNNNNVQDAGETTLKNVSVTTTSVNTQITTQPFSANGNYSISVPPGIYKTKLQLLRPYYTSTPDSVSTTFNRYNQLAIANFALHPIAGIKDYAVNVSSRRRVRPGFDHTFYINYTNNGTDTLNNRNLLFIKDHRFSFTNAVPVPASVSGDSIVWNISNVLPAGSSSISLTLTAATIPQVNIGDTLSSSLYIDSTGDIMTADNLVQIAEIVSSSFDPNDKQENYAGSMPLQEIVDGKTLDYLIRFQNTGSDTAFTIVVRDTLDAQLDAPSFTMLNASHSYQLSIKDGKYITWTFKDIKLLDSMHNEPLSHGYISYRIKPKLPIGIGDMISNRAVIYFDFNPAVLTNNQQTKVSGTPVPSVWTGAVSVTWEDPLNWNTYKVPDINTVVEVPAGVPNFPEINSNAGCYSIHIDPSAALLVKTGFKLNVNGRNN